MRNGKNHEDIICFAGNDWWMHNPMTEKHWMRHLAGQGDTVLFINSIGIGMPGKNSPRKWNRIFRKLRSLARWLRRSDDAWVLTPFVVPLWSVSLITRLNVFLLVFQLRLIMLFLGMRRPVLWAGLPTAAVVVDRLPVKRCVYYIQDNYTAYYDDMSFTRLEQDHQFMLDRADSIICASIGMYDRLKRQYENVEYIPHGVHKSFLDIELEMQAIRPPLLQNIPHPIIGYWGSLESLQDQNLVAYLAERHPEWSLVFIGLPMYDITRLAAYPNIHFLGAVSIENIPELGIHFDVAIMSFVQSEWIKYSCPIKFREYLAMGKPVVGPYIIEVEHAYGGEGKTARSKEEFCRFVEEALEQNTPEAARRRRALVERETWEHSAEKVRVVIGENS